MQVSEFTTRRKGRWKRAEILKLRRLYGSNSEQRLARTFGRTVASIERQASHCHLGKNKVFVKHWEGVGAYKMPRWTRHELTTLCRLHAPLPNLEIARRLGRSYASVVAQAHKLGLHKSAKRLEGMGRENISRRWGTKRRR
jgi:hypothetical protein